jgi:hypothetical protein
VRVTQNLDAIDVWHFYIGDDEIVESTVNFIFCGLARLDCLYAVPFTPQSDIEHFTDGAFIVANQDVSH